MTLAFSLIQISSFFKCIKLRPLSSVVSLLSVVVVDWYRVGVREEYNDDIVLFIQIIREKNCLMITKKKELKFEI